MNSKTPKVSVVVPVYNVEEFLRECVESLINQFLNDIELIFVNDGSTDNSQDILEEFEKQDNRIIIVKQENQGVSAARNKGLELARGDYVGFVDGDDYVNEDYFATLYNVLKNYNVDIVVSNFINYQDGQRIESKPCFEVGIKYNRDFIKEQILPFFIKEDGMNSCCNKLFKKEVIKNALFPVGMTNGEDGMFNMQCFNNSESTLFINYYGYHYREVIGSASRDIVSKDYFQIALDVFNYNYSSNIYGYLDKKVMLKMKTIRLINNVMSLINMFFRKNENISFFKRYLYVRNVVRNETVQQHLKLYWDEIINNKNRYELFVLNSIKVKSVLLLLLVIKYSHLRNNI